MKGSLIGVLHENKPCWRKAKTSRCATSCGLINSAIILFCKSLNSQIANVAWPGLDPFSAFFPCVGSHSYCCKQENLGCVVLTLRPMAVLGNARSQGSFAHVFLPGLYKSLLIFVSFLFLFWCTSQHVEFIVTNLCMWTGRLDYYAYVLSKLYKIN